MISKSVIAIMFWFTFAGCSREKSDNMDFKISVLPNQHSNHQDVVNADKYPTVVAVDTEISYVNKTIRLLDEPSKLSNWFYDAVSEKGLVNEFHKFQGDMAKQKSRNIRRIPKEKKSMVCDVKIVVDYQYFKHVAKRDKQRAVSSVANLMNKVDALFRGVNFNEDGRAENLGFHISNIEVHVERNPGTPFCSADWNPTDFFNEMNRYDFSGACAGLLFTYRKMQSVELFGPSIIKSTINSSLGGICASASVDKVPQKIINNYGSFITNAVPINFMYQNNVYRHTNHMVIQVAHQLAQLFGAPTDDDTKCNTSDPVKMNIMAYPVPPGSYNHNRKFSPCSKIAISNFLKNMTRPCLRICKGSKCSVKRSMNFIPGSSQVQTNITAVGSASDLRVLSPVSILIEILIGKILIEII